MTLKKQTSKQTKEEGEESVGEREEEGMLILFPMVADLADKDWANDE